MSYTRAPLILALLWAVAGCSLDRHPPAYGAAPASDGPWRLSLRDGGGAPLAHYAHDGATYVEGVQGQPYTVRVENPTGGRVEAVITVDGRDVISGEQGDYVTQRGYIIEPYGHVDVRGFRQSWQAVAGFHFTTAEGSYAARRGGGAHVGVVGVAVFPEARPVAPPPMPIAEEAEGGWAEDRAVMDEAPRGQALGGRRRNLGTGYGAALRDHAVEQPFQRTHPDRPAAVLAIYYDDRAGLAARGVEIQRPTAFAAPPGDPQPFPRQARGQGGR